MNKLDLTKVPKNLQPDPIFKGMPSHLKDPKNYKKIEKRLIEILLSDHKHKTASSYVKCKQCQEKREQRAKQMKEIGFKSITQYLTWKKIMQIIINKQSFQLR